jgi:hydroxypyruvate isomerase
MNRRDLIKKSVGAARTGDVSAGGSPSRSKPPLGEAAGVPFRISVMLWTVYPNLPLEERLERIAEAGYKHVELSGQFKSWTEVRFRTINRRMRSLGMGFDATGGLRPYGIADPRQRAVFLAELQHLLTSAEKLEIPAIIVLTGNRVPGMSSHAHRESCVEGLKRAAELIKGKDMRLLLENIDPEENPKYYLTSGAQGFEIVRAVGHPKIQMLYDIYHEQVAEGNLIEKMEKNIDALGLVHVADVPGRHEPGTGEIDYQNIFRKLGELQYDRFIAMEYTPTYNPVQSLKDSRQMALQAARLHHRRSHNLPRPW